LKLDITATVHLHGTTDAAVLQHLEAIKQTLQTLVSEVSHMNAQVQAKIDELRVKVEAETSVVQSAKTLLDGLSAQIAALKDAAAGADPAVLDAITALETTVDSNKQALADAVTANTPAA
jgi:cell division septum initiation protein DivIVA